MFYEDQLKKPVICEIDLSSSKKVCCKKIAKIVHESTAFGINIFLGRLSSKKILVAKELVKLLLNKSIAITVTGFNPKMLLQLKTCKISALRLIFNKKMLKNIKKIALFFKDIKMPIALVDLNLFVSFPTALKIMEENSIKIVNVFSNPTKKIQKSTYAFMLKKLACEAKKRQITLLSDLPLMALINENFSGICPAGKLSFCIDSNANLSVCRYSKTKFSFQDDFFEIWAEFKIITKICKQCTSCLFFEKCGGGCVVRRTSKIRDKNCWV